MIIKRRKDYEEYERLKHQRPWRRMYQIGNNIYRVMMIYYPAFWQEWLIEPMEGRPQWKKLRGVYLTLRYDVIMYYGPARTTEELDATAEMMNARWRKMVESGAIERCFRDDIEPLDLDIWGDDDAAARRGV